MEVRITDPGQIVTWIVVGIIAGILAGMVVRGRHFRLLTSAIIGLLGAIIGGVLFSLLHISLPPFFNTSIEIRLSDVLISFVGAVIVLLIAGLIYRQRIA